VTRDEALTLIAAERLRQIEVEGWTSEHDDEHAFGEMQHAALAYLLSAERRPYSSLYTQPTIWPWAAQWWKPKGPGRDLVRAGALCMAESDRLIRRHQNHLAEKLAPVVRLFERIVNALMTVDREAA